MNLSDDFHAMLTGHEDDASVHKQIASMVLAAPETPESNGLLALMYHEGIGVAPDCGRCFALAEKAASEGGDGLGCFLMGYMCDSGEVPDARAAEYGPDDAERFYLKCAASDSRWAEHAHLWLGDYYMDPSGDGDPAEAVRHYEAIGRHNAEAAGRLSDYYWEQLTVDAIIPEEFRTPDLKNKVFEWTHEAVRLNPHDYSYRMGWCYADGIGCDAQGGFRLARKYWEDAYEFGDWRAAEAIATLYEERLAALADRPADDWDRRRCEREIESWRRLAALTRERQQKQDEEASEP